MRAVLHQATINLHYDTDTNALKACGVGGSWIDIDFADDAAIAGFVRAVARRDELVKKAQKAVPQPVKPQASPLDKILRIQGDGTREGYLRRLAYAITVGDSTVINTATDEERSEAAKLVEEMWRSDKY